MGIGQFLKEGFHEHKASAFKIILSLVAVVVFLFAISAYNTSQNLKTEQTQAYQAAVLNHTKTIDEIQAAVVALKASNAADHTVTIKYINCVLVGITQANPPNSQSAVLAVYQSCLANSQIAGTPAN